MDYYARKYGTTLFNFDFLVNVFNLISTCVFEPITLSILDKISKNDLGRLLKLGWGMYPDIFNIYLENIM